LISLFISKISALVQPGPGAYPASYTMCAGIKAAGAWRWPPTPI